jgi:hypothetical protein
MLKYNDLTKAQKRFVDAVLTEFPEIKKTGVVNRKELESIYWTLNDKRAAGGEKVGFPNWLTAKNKIDRGVFDFPLPEGAVAKVKKAAAAEKEKFEKIVNEGAVAVPEVEDYVYDEELENIKADLAGINS